MCYFCYFSGELVCSVVVVHVSVPVVVAVTSAGKTLKYSVLKANYMTNILKKVISVAYWTNEPS